VYRLSKSINLLQEETNVSDSDRHPSGVSRRDFIKASAAGAAVAGLSPFAAEASAAGAGGRSARVLLKGGYVITLDPALGDFSKADLLIEGSKIAAIAPRIEAGEAEIIDATSMIVMPGFIDTHRHIWQGSLRNIACDATLQEYFVQILGAFAPVYRSQDVYAGNLVSALGAIDAGVTTLLDWSHIQNTPEHTDAAINALQESGLRAVFAYGTPNTSVQDWWVDSKLNHPEDIKRLRRQYFSSRDQLLTLALAPRGPEFTTPQVSEHDWKLAREVGARISVHVGVSVFGQHGKLEQMHRAGLLGPDTTYIHCCTLNDRELQAIADTGGTVSIASPIELQMGHGLPPLQRVLDRGIQPSLSVDVETSMAGDMFTQMRSVFTLQRALVHERMLHGEKELPRLLTTRDVLRMATIEGARACGLDDKVGTLTPGKDADIVLLRSDRLNMVPLNDAVGAVVMCADTGNIDTVFIAGKAMKRGGKLLDVDLDRVRKLAMTSRDYLVSASGFKPKGPLPR
jgi:5-methylthioadenosine/S-adenosylhomocysteine deaminase